MSATEVASAINACLIEQYGLVDKRRSDEALRFCSEDFMIHAMGMDLDRATFETMMIARKEATYDTRHLINNLRIIDDDGDRVTVSYIAVVHRLDHGDDAPTISVADAEEQWIRDEDRWLCADRSLDIVFDGRPADKR